MKKTVIIFSQSFDINSGGALALHKLCHLVNKLGRESFIYPYFPGAPLDCLNEELFLKNIKITEENLQHYKVYSEFNTPVLHPDSYKVIEGNESYIVIYPEITMGNPLKSKNVVRWFLHNPGFHTGKIYYETNEIYFKFGEETECINIPNSKMSSNLLTVTHFPSYLYNEENVANDRAGTAYCIRKGKGKKISHDIENSILIDGLSHEEISSIFKRVKQFISYDTRTYYSQLAAACGCESIVIPDEGISEEECFPEEGTRYGVSYGFENLEKSIATRSLVSDYLTARDLISENKVVNFLIEIDNFFDQYKRFK
jgi:hypothetical protein